MSDQRSRDEIQKDLERLSKNRPSMAPANDHFNNQRRYQGDDISSDPAPTLRKCAAFLIDGMVNALICGILIVPAMWISFGSMKSVAADIAMGDVQKGLSILIFASLAAVVIHFVFIAFCLTRWGATPGRMIMGVEVRTVDGELLSYGQVIVREYIGGFLCGITMGIGYLMSLFREDRRGLHELVSSTQSLKSREEAGALAWALAALIFFAPFLGGGVAGFFSALQRKHSASKIAPVEQQPIDKNAPDPIMQRLLRKNPDAVVEQPAKNGP